jgi:CheY-like chemotaxis protein
MNQNEYNPKSYGNLPLEVGAEKHIQRILVAEDDNEMRRLLVHAIFESGYEVIQCHDGIEFFKHLESFILNKASLDFDLIISDILMPGLTGLEIFEDLHDYKGFPPMILITAFGDDNIHQKAKRLGAAGLFDKPFEIDDLLEKIHEILPPVSK